MTIDRHSSYSPHRRFLIALSAGVAILQCFWSWAFLQDQLDLGQQSVEATLRTIHATTDDDGLFPTRIISTQLEYKKENSLFTPPSPSATQLQLHQHKLKLRFDWTSLERSGTLARRMDAMQRNCSNPNATFRYRNRFGLGSDLHVYSQAMCNALQLGTIRVQTALPWIWLDSSLSACPSSSSNATFSSSAMTCYFPQSELFCPQDHRDNNFSSNHKNSNPWNGDASSQRQPGVATGTSTALNNRLNMTRGRGKIANACPTILAEIGGIPEMRAATTEFLFTRVSHTVQREAERQLNLVFGGGERNDNSPKQQQTKKGSSSSFVGVPPNLITVHIRWGDKADEMTLVPIAKYIRAVDAIVEERRNAQQQQQSLDENDTVHIFLATEDPNALAAFQDAAPSDWRIYVDQYYRDMLPHRRQNNAYNGSPLMAQDLAGRPGLVALGSLLVSLEANAFVLTTSSNWSRLMNELRRTVLEARCRNCTRVIDLSPGEW